MGCCASSDGASPPPGAETKSTPAATSGSSTNGTPRNQSTPSSTQPMSSSGGPASYIPKEAKGAKAFLPATAASNPNQDASQPAPVPTSQSKGPKAVRGWAPPAKEWDKETKKKGDETRIEIQEEWDEEGNLVRTTIKKIKTPDWKWKTQKTTEIIPASEAAKMGKSK